MSVQDTITSFSTEYNLIKDERKLSEGDLSTKATSWDQTKKSSVKLHQDKAVAKPLLGLTLSFITGSVGSGWLAIPKAFSIFGLVSGIFLFTVSTLNSIIAVKLLSNLMCYYKNCDFYSDMVQAILGKKWKMAHSVIYLLNLFGSCIAYI